jgi:hypothetical protein
MGQLPLFVLCGLFLCGCSRDHAGAVLAPKLVQEGKTVTWADGRLIYVQRRQGNTLSGVRLVQKALAGPDRTVEAEHGLISCDADGRTLRVTLYNAVVRSGARQSGTLKEFSVICAR